MSVDDTAGESRLFSAPCGKLSVSPAVFDVAKFPIVPKRMRRMRCRTESMDECKAGDPAGPGVGAGEVASPTLGAYLLSSDDRKGVPGLGVWLSSAAGVGAAGNAPVTAAGLAEPATGETGAYLLCNDDFFSVEGGMLMIQPSSSSSSTDGERSQAYVGVAGAF